MVVWTIARCNIVPTWVKVEVYIKPPSSLTDSQSYSGIQPFRPTLFRGQSLLHPPEMGAAKKPVNIFKLNRGDDPKEVLNWRLWFAVFSFGIMGAARGIDEGLISGYHHHDLARRPSC